MPLRTLEAQARRSTVAFARWMRRRGATLLQAAGHLTVSPRTLAAWRKSSRQPLPRGRPLHLADPLTRTTIIDTLQDLGPSVGIPHLRLIFPAVTRSELTDHLQTLRRDCYLEHQQSLHHLQWQGIGRVWSIDYTELFYPLDECFRWCLAIRDLASHCQLLALPADHDSAEIALHGLKMLFVRYNPPLVLKADNGSHFTAGNVQQLLQDYHVTPLHSPPYTPGYNGAIEAGIGSIKARLFQHTLYHGRCDHPSSDDLEAARLQVNACSRPFGENGPAPDDLWNTRTPITGTERNIFLDTLAKYRSEVQCSHGTRSPNHSHRDFRANVERIAVRQALVALGYLVIQKARISPPVVA